MPEMLDLTALKLYKLHGHSVVRVTDSPIEIPAAVKRYKLHKRSSGAVDQLRNNAHCLMYMPRCALRCIWAGFHPKSNKEEKLSTGFESGGSENFPNSNWESSQPSLFAGYYVVNGANEVVQRNLEEWSQVAASAPWQELLDS